MVKFDRVYFSKTVPAQMTDYFTKSSEISKRVRRTSKIQPNMLYIPHYQTTRLQRCIKYQGVKIWNDIPSEIQKNHLFFLKNFQPTFITFLLKTGKVHVVLKTS